MATQPVRLASQPGVKRDGTRLEGNYHVDAQWCRWHRGLPRKMRGFKTAANSMAEKTYGMHAFVTGGLHGVGTQAGYEYVHMGTAGHLYQQVLDYDGTLQTSSDRIPAGFTSNPDNLWQFASMYDTNSSSNRVIAHVAPNLGDIANSATGKVYFGDMTDTAALTDTGAVPVSGGILVLYPYLLAFGDAGDVSWTTLNRPDDWPGANNARVTGSKLVCGLPLRGTGTGPGGLLWSLDSLIRVSFTSESTGYWAFDTLTDDISVLSSRSVIEYDGIYYWAGVDRFMMFNGVVRELPNQMNLDWFFNDAEGGINYAARQKAFAFKLPRWGEIWWCFPRGAGVTECNYAVIYNVREDTWYDTALPNFNYCSGTFATVYEHPLVTAATNNGAGDFYRLIKQDEKFMDFVDGPGKSAPVQSYFETNEFSTLEGQQPTGKTLSVARIEPDFVQTGDMTVTVRGRPNARATPVDGDSVTFSDTAATPTDQTVKVKDSFRLMSFRFESNTPGGNYVAGETYAHIEQTDGRIEG